MRSCVFCKFRYEKGSKITFHRFPIDFTRDLWVQNMSVHNWTPKKYDSLCSKHFEGDCLMKHANRTKLKKGSVPTIFNESFEVPLEDEPGTSDRDDEQDVGDVMVMDQTSQTSKDPKSSTQNYTMTIFTSTREGVISESVKPMLSTPCGLKRKFGSNLENSATQKSPGTIFTENLKTGSHNSDIGGSRKKPRTALEIQESISHDHRYTSTPSTSNKALQRAKEALRRSQARVKVLSKHLTRLKIKVSCLKTMIDV